MAGTWGSGALPDEYTDFALMHGMPWSWEQLQSTPQYVRTYCLRFLEAQAAETNRQERPDGIRYIGGG